MCWKGAWLRGKGFPIECPGHEECTANLYRAAALSEYELGKKIGDQIGLQKCLVRYVTTDGDGRSAKGIEDALTAVEPMWKVERLADHVHLEQSQFRASLRAQYSPGMFHGVELSERSKRYLKKMDTDFKYNQDYILRPEVQKRKLQQNAEKLAEHKTWREMNKKHDYYCKGQLDPQPALQFQDHDSYCKPKLPRPAAD
ncbi:unnamed protein product [Mytilus edulis]|uniref:Mutator-like transposase domain-containing protein n=1 Tax=Mytilus edulis TaxID=6550 RepID=A0A8S3SX80_MYTED|nr:unnamed protein product [Mytilus edulis]